MKKKFDFSAEIESAEARTNQEYRERYEEENKLLKVNAEELMKLNDNIVKSKFSTNNFKKIRIPQFSETRFSSFVGLFSCFYVYKQ